MSHLEPTPEPTRRGKRVAERPERARKIPRKNLIVVLALVVLAAVGVVLAVVFTGGHGDKGEDRPSVSTGDVKDATSVAKAALTAYTTGKCDDLVALTTKASTDAKALCLGNAKNKVVTIYGFELGAAKPQGTTVTFAVTYKTRVTPVCASQDKTACPPSQEYTTNSTVTTMQEDGSWKFAFATGS